MSGNIEEVKGRCVRRRFSFNGFKGGEDLEVCVVRRWRSLPGVGVYLGDGKVKEVGKKSRDRRILRKTWDRVKGIIQSPGGKGAGGGERRGEFCSAPATPLKGDSFFGDGGGEDERDRIARNYALLQKRLSQEFRSSASSSLKGRGGAFRELFEWESHPSRRKVKDGKDGGLSSRHLKELAWLDKQLEKINTEKKRLEEELRRQVEREIRVQKMKEAIKCSVNDRVYNIRTESGVKVRVEGITSEYAMKVYEWEEKRGIGVEMSALGYFDPKYRDDDEAQKVGDVKGCEEDKDEVVGPLDLINERLKESEGKGDSLGERGALLLAECVALGEIASGGGSGQLGADQDGRVSSTASSCCCSAEYEFEHTDSFATKNNSGASNTDSEVYDKRCTITRRRSSDCVSTPDRGSPGLSAFTSEEEEDVKKEEVVEAKGESVVPLCVKAIVIDEDGASGECGSNVFVQTKRTIFSPISADVCGVACTPKVVGVVSKPGYKAQPKTQLNRVFPCNVPVYASPMASRREFGVRKLPPRTNARVPARLLIGGGIAPAFGRGCLIARSSSFNGMKPGDNDEVCAGAFEGDGAVGFGVSKSKSTGSIKRSIAKFLFGGKGGGGPAGSDCSEERERRGSKSGFVRRLGGLWRKDGE